MCCRAPVLFPPHNTMRMNVRETQEHFVHVVAARHFRSTVPVRKQDVCHPWAVCVFCLLLETRSFNRFCSIFVIPPDVKKHAAEFRRRSKGRVYAAAARDVTSQRLTRSRVLVDILKRAPANNSWVPVFRRYIDAFRKNT